jgi:RHS repeat-associated protein
MVTGANASTTWFIYDAGGALIAEHTTSTAATQPSREYVYGVTGLLATVANPSTQNRTAEYVTPDHLSSPRIVTDGTTGNVISRHDYLPFGEEIFAGFSDRVSGLGGYATAANLSQADGLRQQFTTYERDIETSLDFAKARYYGNKAGRFTSVDPLLASGLSSNPQTFNRYVYVVNNPLTLVDRDGMLSTHTDWEGDIIAVINDGDTGVYRHENNADGKAPTEYQITKRAF